MESIRICVSGHRSWMRRAASMPSSPGSAMSSTATSGADSAANDTARPESPKLPTTRMSGCAARRACNPSRTTAWSSSNSTLMDIAWRRHVDDQPRAAAREFDAEHATVRFGTLPHRRQPEAAAARAARPDRFGEAAPVVLHRKAQAFAITDGNLYGSAAAVLGGIGERLLHDAEQSELGVARKAQFSSRDAGGNLHSSALAEDRGVPA